MSNEWTDRDVIRIVNLNHETKRNLDALEREVDRRLKKKSQRYVSRAEKQIVGFMILVLAGLIGLALTVTGHMIGGFAANFLGWQSAVTMNKKAALRAGTSESGRLVERPKSMYTAIVSGFGGKVNE